MRLPSRFGCRRRRIESKSWPKCFSLSFGSPQRWRAALRVRRSARGPPHGMWCQIDHEQPWAPFDAPEDGLLIEHVGAASCCVEDPNCTGEVLIVRQGLESRDDLFEKVARMQGSHRLYQRLAVWYEREVTHRAPLQLNFDGVVAAPCPICPQRKARGAAASDGPGLRMAWRGDWLSSRLADPCKSASAAAAS
jgi:hypothetical protein